MRRLGVFLFCNDSKLNKKLTKKLKCGIIRKIEGRTYFD